MTMPYERLRLAQAQLDHARDQLGEALALAKAQGYSPNRVAAIEKACVHNNETHRQVSNIMVNIRTPQYEQPTEGFEKED